MFIRVLLPIYLLTLMLIYYLHLLIYLYNDPLSTLDLKNNFGRPQRNHLTMYQDGSLLGY